MVPGTYRPSRDQADGLRSGFALDRRYRRGVTACEDEPALGGTLGLERWPKRFTADDKPTYRYESPLTSATPMVPVGVSANLLEALPSLLLDGRPLDLTGCGIMRPCPRSDYQASRLSGLPVGGRWLRRIGRNYDSSRHLVFLPVTPAYDAPRNPRPRAIEAASKTVHSRFVPKIAESLVDVCKSLRQIPLKSYFL